MDPPSAALAGIPASATGPAGCRGGDSGPVPGARPGCRQGVLAFERAGQGVETTVPKLPVVLQPSLPRLQWACIQSAQVQATAHFALDQAGPLQHPDVLGCSRERHVERCRQLADRAFAVIGKPLQHGAAGTVGQGLEQVIEGGMMFNHMVDNTHTESIVNHLV